MPHPIVFVVAALLLVGSWGTLVILWYRSHVKDVARIRALSRDPSRVEEQFARFFSERGVPEDIQAIVRRYLQERVAFAVKNFPVLPEDDVEQVYHVDSEDLADDVEYWARKLRIKLPDASKDAAVVKTVADVVLYLAAHPRTVNKKKRAS